MAGVQDRREIAVARPFMLSRGEAKLARMASSPELTAGCFGRGRSVCGRSGRAFHFAGQA